MSTCKHVYTGDLEPVDVELCRMCFGVRSEIELVTTRARLAEAEALLWDTSLFFSEIRSSIVLSPEQWERLEELHNKLAKGTT